MDREFDPNYRLRLVHQEYEKQENEKANRLHQPEIAGTNWVSLGPTNGAGRMTAIGVHPTISGTVYAGAAGGGLWKTTDGGSSWTSLTDSINDLFVGAVAIAPSSPNVIYLGSGEGNTFTPGIGLLKSTDGGNTWQFPSSVIANSFYKISVHPTNPQDLVVGAVFAGYRSTNGGQSWTTVIPSSSVTDIVRVPGNPQVLYATTRGANQILKSTDDGITWASKSNGVPLQSLDRLSIAISPSNPLVLYVAGASSQDAIAHIYKTTDGGESWFELLGISSDPNLRYYFATYNQSSYDNTLVVSPSDPNVVIAGGVSYVKSTDGGATWATPFGGGGYPHVDVHDLQYQGSTLYIANDGGIWSSIDNAQSATDRNSTLVTRQYYTVANDPINRNRIFGGTQDNGTDRRPDSGGTAWTDVIGGDGFDCAVNPYAPETFYGTIQYGEIHRTNSAGTTGYFYNKISPTFPSGEPGATPFFTVLTMDPNNPAILYTGSYRVWKSTDGGDSWSPLPTTTTDGSSWPIYTLSKIVVARSDSSILMASHGNTLFRSTNGGATWVSASSGLPYCNGIEIDPQNPNIAYSASANSGVYMTTNGGASWTARASGLPAFSAQVVRIDPTDSNVLFCGTQVGVYRSIDKGLNWTKFGTGLPSVSIYDLRILNDGSALRAATHGRGLWELQIPSNGNSAPSAAINLPTSNILVKGSSINFQGVISDPDSGDFATGTWYFSDSGEAISSGGGTISTTHVFNRTGAFAISLTAKDSHGTLGQAVRNFFVLNDPLQNCGAATPCAPVPSGLVAWWRGEGDAQDQTGTNNGKLFNDMSFAQGRVCAGFSGDGTSSKKIIVADSTSLALTQSLTLEGWILLNVVDPGGGYMLLQRGEKTYDTNLWGAYSLLTNGGHLYFTITPNSSGNPNTAFVSSPSTLPAGQFVHVAATLDNSTGQIKLYQNGALVSQVTTSARPYGDLNLGQNAVSIGGLPSDNVGSSVSHSFNGVIDELSVYNRALSASEIQSIYSAGSAATGAAGKCTSTQTIPITIQTSPVGQSFTADGTTFTTSQTLSWVPGSGHTISTTSPQAGGTGTQFVWSSWSDGLGISHSVSPGSGTTYTANFTTQFQLTMNAGAGGQVSPASSFFNNGQVVQITATPNNGFSFASWAGSGAGSFTGGTNPVNLTMNGPITETASFTAVPMHLPTAGLYNPAAGTFFLRNSNSTGVADISFAYGPAGAGWLPLVGDWNGDGVDTIGLYNPVAGTFFLRNSNSTGVADISLAYGPGGAGWLPLVGDWNGDGVDTVGLYNPAAGTFFLRNSNSTGVANLSFAYGPAGIGWLPLVGDWNGDGMDTVGLYNPSAGTFFLRNSNSSGVADISFAYGPAGAGWLPTVSDWNGDGTTTVGLYNPAGGGFFLRNSNSTGVADITFSYGPASAGWRPLVGDWNGP